MARARRRQRMCDRCRTRNGNIKCDGSPANVPCTFCKEQNRPCHFSKITSTTRKGSSGVAAIDGRAFLGKKRVDVLVAGDASRTRRVGDRKVAGRVATYSRLSMENGLKGRQVFNTLVRNWEGLPTDRGQPLPVLTLHHGGKASENHEGPREADNLANAPNDERPQDSGQLEDAERIVMEDIDTAVLDQQDVSQNNPNFDSIRFRLPSSELLDAIHLYSSQLYNTDTEHLPLFEDGTLQDMFYSMNGSALIALGILAQEYMRNLLPSAKGKQLTDEQCAIAPAFDDIVGSAPPDTVGVAEKDRRYVYKSALRDLGTAIGEGWVDASDEDADVSNDDEE
ncbi:uncharacterized protein SPPG_04000 [Spizellomyces punctatus DAOM BR117]|uniref:Zn(2)-C6 fungal-type domain-containing protein n=1 Tax=Spizellomyces punctatus (strain DAOM BR117) TaxID=645134 RepID=A0A0L0HJ26_SPIPD|nr:uncharacterized protein SPPG_04000 [Spizellomyces punctatus DAOM BR117]KND00900.1 hypothetical protein SPPG_04000 [Spizellomyces punctatus DAOM BR117]|eukprot:XP_016608939.1 hypothetical protein SPPG_04000 [Spizellomyces punctatus DAOM BR117]